MRIGVLLSQQNPSESSPEHYVSRPLAQSFLNFFHNGRRAAIQVSDSLIWIRCELTFGQLKALLRPNPGPRIVPRINPPGPPEGLLLYYPTRNQSSYRSISEHGPS